MFASICSLQKVMVSQSGWLRVAAATAVAVTTVGIVPPVSAGTLPIGTVEVAQASAHDAARCQELYSVWQRYKGVSTNGSGRDIQSQAALQDCKNGRLDAGIAQLEQLLRNDRIPVPQETSSAAR